MRDLRKSLNMGDFRLCLFEWLEAHIDELVALNQSSLQHCIARCCQIKADVVARDETEKGDRALLNLGHTFGHAIENTFRLRKLVTW